MTFHKIECSSLCQPLQRSLPAPSRSASSQASTRGRRSRDSLKLSSDQVQEPCEWQPIPATAPWSFHLVQLQYLSQDTARLSSMSGRQILQSVKLAEELLQCRERLCHIKALISWPCHPPFWYPLSSSLPHPTSPNGRPSHLTSSQSPPSGHR